MIARACIVVVLAVVGFVVLVAQATDDEQSACHADAVKFCHYALEGTPFTVAACLAANKTRLSARCRAVLNSHGL